MAANNNASVIYIDPRDKLVHYYGTVNGKIVHDTTNYKARDFDSEFFEGFVEILGNFMKKYTPAQSVNCTIVLPDSVIVTDIMTLPAMKGGALKSTIETNLSGMYKNRKDLKLNTFFAVQNKQFSEVCVTGVRDAILAATRNSCSTARFMTQSITFAAETSARAAAALNPKLKGMTYLLVDMKEDFTRFVYVFKGVALGFSLLPFGYGVIEKNKLAAEDMLFEHSVAELAVLNARERAKAKALTVMGDGNADATQIDTGEGGEENGEGGEGGEEENSFSGTEQLVSTRTQDTTIKTLPKKTPRKLPKYMLRPVPDTDEGIINENFRIIAKWALCYIQGNSKLINLGEFKGVYVNIPEHLNHVIASINEEKEENRVDFFTADFESKDDVVLRNIEMYGGMLIGPNKNNNVF